MRSTLLILIFVCFGTGNTLAQEPESIKFRGTASAAFYSESYFDGRKRLLGATTWRYGRLFRLDYRLKNRLQFYTNISWFNVRYDVPLALWYSGELLERGNNGFSTGIRYFVIQKKLITVDLLGDISYRKKFESRIYAFDIVESKQFRDLVFDTGTRLSAYAVNGRIQISIEPQVSFVVLRQDEEEIPSFAPTRPKSSFRWIFSVGYRFIKVKAD